MRTVLLVEDEETLRELIEFRLQSRGYNVISAAGAGEALEISASLNDESVDVLLTDMILPGLTGSELARLITRKRTAMKVLFMSGIMDPLTAHADRPFIQKPFQLSELLLKLDSLFKDADA